MDKNKAVKYETGNVDLHDKYGILLKVINVIAHKCIEMK